MSSRTGELEGTLGVLGPARDIEHLLHRPEGSGVNARLRYLLLDERSAAPIGPLDSGEDNTDDVDGRHEGNHDEDADEQTDDGVHRSKPLVNEEISMATWRACMSPSACRRDAASGTV